MTVEMFLDVSCPWCHGGLGTNRRVLDELAADPAVPALDVQWRFMRLHPMPRDGGLPVDEYFGSWGGDDAVARARSEVSEYARSVGVRVDFDRYTYLHDPFTAHRLLALVRDDGGDDLPDLWSLARVVWSANFVGGVDVSDAATLRDAIEAGGLELPERVWTLLDDADGHRAATLADHARALDVGLDRVPRIVVDGRIVPTWVDPAQVRRELRAAISSAAGR